MREYNYTRGPWAATLALIKVDEIGQNQQTSLNAKNIQNWWNFLGRGTACLYIHQNGCKKALLSSHTTAR